MTNIQISDLFTNNRFIYTLNLFEIKIINIKYFVNYLKSFNKCYISSVYNTISIHIYCEYILICMYSHLYLIWYTYALLKLYKHCIL